MFPIYQKSQWVAFKSCQNLRHHPKAAKSAISLLNTCCCCCRCCQNQSCTTIATWVFLLTVSRLKPFGGSNRVDEIIRLALISLNRKKLRLLEIENDQLGKKNRLMLCLVPKQMIDVKISEGNCVYFKSVAWETGTSGASYLLSSTPCR